jgi:hypothetical protein
MHPSAPDLPGQHRPQSGMLLAITPGFYEDAQLDRDEQTLLRRCASALSPVSVNGWLLDYDSDSSRFVVFLFCFARRVLIPSSFIAQLQTIQVYAMSLGDYLDATMWHQRRSPADPLGQESVLSDEDFRALRESFQFLALESMRLRLCGQAKTFQQQAQVVCRYRDALRQLEDVRWRQHIFVPEPSLLPSHLVA